MSPFSVLRHIVTGTTTSKDAFWVVFWFVFWTVLLAILVTVLVIMQDDQGAAHVFLGASPVLAVL